MHFRLSSSMARRMLLLLILRCTALGSAENSSLPTAPLSNISRGLPDRSTGSAVLRFFYVITGLCGLISLYFLIRAFRCVSASNQHLVSQGAGEVGGRARDSGFGLVLNLDSVILRLIEVGSDLSMAILLPQPFSGAVVTGVWKIVPYCKN